ncbi:MAG: hypothetical protein ACK55I_08100, partial [bacterium]
VVMGRVGLVDRPVTDTPRHRGRPDRAEVQPVEGRGGGGGGRGGGGRLAAALGVECRGQRQGRQQDSRPMGDPERRARHVELWGTGSGTKGPQSCVAVPSVATRP